MAALGDVSVPRRGEVYLVGFDPTVGAEIRKTRPALILQNELANRHSPITIVAAITCSIGEPLYPAEVLVKASGGGPSADSVVLLNQIRSMHKQRLVQRLGRLKPATMDRVDPALAISLGLVRV